MSIQISAPYKYRPNATREYEESNKPSYLRKCGNKPDCQTEDGQDGITDSLTLECVGPENAVQLSDGICYDKNDEGGIKNWLKKWPEYREEQRRNGKVLPLLARSPNNQSHTFSEEDYKKLNLPVPGDSSGVSQTDLYFAIESGNVEEVRNLLENPLIDPGYAENQAFRTAVKKMN